MRKTRFYVLTMILLILVFASGLRMHLADSEGAGAIVESGSLAAHAPIVIIGDADFTPGNGVVGGSGTAEDPYIIEDWDINASTAEGIFITNTTAFFIIRNVFVHDGELGDHDGIKFYNVTDGKVIDTNSTRNRWGIHLDFLCWFNNISRNIFSNNSGNGIRARGANHTLSHNVIIGNDNGISAGALRNSTIISNTITGSWTEGITAHPGFSNNAVLDNNITSNGYWGISVFAENSLISRNNVSNNVYGIWVRVGDHNNVSCNVVSSNEYIGIKGTTHESVFFHNRVFNNNVGIEIDGSNNTVFDNFFAYNSGNNTQCGSWRTIWNITKTAGRNIIGGPYLGGNYYGDYTGVDNDADGIGDTPHVIPGLAGSVDYLPLTYLYNLTITATDGGTTSPSPGIHTYGERSAVSVEATPSLGYIFDHWEFDDISNTTNPITVTMNANHTLHSVFLWVGTSNLTISTTTGGTTSPAPGTYTYTNGTVATITAIPNIGYTFDYWELDGNNNTTNPKSVNMDMNHTLHAVFSWVGTYNLTITVTAGGTTPAPGTYTYTNGTVATVTAIPNIYYIFDHWKLNGTNISSTNPINVMMNANYALHAVYAPRLPGGNGRPCTPVTIP